MFAARIWEALILGTLLCISGLMVSAVHPSSSQDGDLRFKRDTSPPCKDKYKTVPDHSACLAKSASAKNSGVSEADKKLIVDLHNQYRAVPSATNMLKLEWDEEIANIAQHWADSCHIEHDPGARRSIPGTYSVGQNLAMNTMNWTHAITLWNDEVKVFTYGGTNDFHSVGHYTQLVWADTQRVGCGYADCPDTKYFVCNYGPGGNSGDYTKPYIQGTKCAECSGCGASGLCECPEPCLNGGQLFRNNCTCKCKMDFYIQNEHCALDCDAVKTDPDYCSGDFGNNKCSLIATSCPNKCHVCPYAGKGYVEGSVAIVKRSDENGGNSQRGDIIGVISLAVLAVLKFC